MNPVGDFGHIKTRTSLKAHSLGTPGQLHAGAKQAKEEATSSSVGPSFWFSFGPKPEKTTLRQAKMEVHRRGLEDDFCLFGATSLSTSTLVGGTGAKFNHRRGADVGPCLTT